MALFFALGALTVTTATPEVEGQEKELPPLKEPFTERVTYRQYRGGGKFVNPQVGVPAYRKKVDGKQYFMLSVGQTDGGLPPVGSEITDGDGVKWTITHSSSGATHICEVARKSVPAKTKATKK